MIPFHNALSISVSEGDPYNGADIVLDFAGVKNGGVPFYRRDGVVHTSAADAGFTGEGIFDSFGYQAAKSTDRLRGEVSVTGDYVIAGKFMEPNKTFICRLWQLGSSGVARLASSGAYASAPASISPANSTSFVFGRSGGLIKASVNGGAVFTGGSYSTSTNGQLNVGNDVSAGAQPFSHYIKLISIHKATLTDAEIQALGA